MTGTGEPPPRAPDGGAGGDGPVPVDVLADLHAGVLDEATAARVRRRAEADPAARAVLAALDATVADLAAFGRGTALGGADPVAPVPTPPDVAARLDAALAAAGPAAHPLPTGPGRAGAAPAPPSPVQPAAPSSGPSADVVDLATRRRRRLALGGGGGLLAAAAAAAVVVGVTRGPAETPGSAQAGAPPAGSAAADTPLPLAGTQLAVGLDAALGRFDYGPLDDPAVLDACLAANGVPGAVEPLGAQEVSLDGRPGVLVVLPTDQLARFRVLVVGPDCAAGNPAALADAEIGR